MEDKIYFEPSQQKPKKKRKKNTKKVIKLLVFFLVLFVIVVILIYFLSGKTTISGRFPDNLRNESLKCTTANYEYPYVNSARPESTETSITTVFYGEKELLSMSLNHSMVFKSKLDAGKAESLTHAQFAKILANNGLKFDEFDNKFTILDERLVVSLHNTDGELTNNKKPFFLLDNADTAELNTIKDYQNYFETKGFTCESTLD